MREWLETPMGTRPQDAPQGGGIQGFLRRFGTGFQQGLIPSRGQALMRGLNPGAYLAGGLWEGFGDAFRGLGSRSGAPLPSWMNPNFVGPDPSATPSSLPAGYVPPDFSGLTPQQAENNLYGQGSGMMRGPQSPTRGVGTRGGEVMARGQAARDMVESMRGGGAQNQRNLAAQARNAMREMFRDSER
jgi:hypothetical protein